MYLVKKNKFINLQKITENSVTILTNADFNINSIKTLKIQINNQILTLHDFYYNSNTVINFIFFEILKQQKFEIKKIKKSDDLYLFKIINLENQIFITN